MKQIKFLITGLLLFTALTMNVADVRADDICNPNNIKNHYKGLYCGIRLHSNETADDEIITTLASQFAMDKDIIKEILAGTICKTVKEYAEADQTKLPKSVRNACLPSGLSLEQTMGSWTIFTDIRNAYEKENVIQRSANSLKFKFKASEQYWDGKVGDPLLNPGDAPFDLIVDLNLIEIVLFGSKAQWMQDVYSFPEEEGGGEEGEVPMDEALPTEEEEGQAPATPETPESGITVTTEEEEGQAPADCVSPDDPDADTGDGPGSSYENPVCGNQTIDVLSGEQCDDGNKQSGDGCNQYCRTETTGSNDMCADPQAVTFKTPETKTQGAQGTGNAGGTEGGQPTEETENQKIECPPGTVPKKSTTLTGPEEEAPQTVQQSPEYPGPYLGGTLKQYPESNPPICAPGETQMGTNDDGTPICWQTELCADPAAARTFLAAMPPFSIPDGDWESLSDDDPRKKMVESIEALFCVNVTKANRPKSPYQMIEGCVDCHISAMVDALEKALETNVSPLANTTSAFSISSKYGPTFSFNLNTAVKRVLKYQFSDTASSAIKKANQAAAESLKKNTPPKLSIYTSDSPLKALGQAANKAETTLTAIQDDTRMFNLSSQAVGDQEVGGRLISLLTQMRDSFISMESKYEGLVGSIGLDTKEQCKP